MIQDSLPSFFFSFFWVMNDLSAKEGVGVETSSFLTDICQFHATYIAVYVGILWYSWSSHDF